MIIDRYCDLVNGESFHEQQAACELCYRYDICKKWFDEKTQKDKGEHKMKKLFVSIPMKGRTEEEIKKSVQKMKKFAEVFEGEELELIDSYIEDKPPVDVSERIWYLGRSIEKLANADIFIGITGDWDFDGCFTERTVAERYGIKIYRVDPLCVIEDFKEYLDAIIREKKGLQENTYLTVARVN